MAIRGGNYLVDFLLAVVQKAGEMLQCTLGLKFSYSSLLSEKFAICQVREICNILSVHLRYLGLTWLRTVCVWSSVPVTILPTARKAAVWTFTCSRLANGIQWQIPRDINIPNSQQHCRDLSVAEKRDQFGHHTGIDHLRSEKSNRESAKKK